MKPSHLMIAIVGLVATIGPATAQPLSTPPAQCSSKRPASVPCVCGLKPAMLCPANAWCSFTPEGMPQCTARRPLRR